MTRPRRTAAPLALAFALGAIALGAIASGACASAATSGGLGRRAPDFTLNDLDGHPVRLADLTARKDVVVVSFWATWCRPCLVELPFLQEVYTQHRAEGLSVHTQPVTLDFLHVPFVF